jgi:hypothetical protein
MSFSQIKRQEAQSRLVAIRKARRSPAAAAAQQRRASLVGDGAKWRITNLNQVARGMAKNGRNRKMPARFSSVLRIRDADERRSSSSDLAD